MSIIFDSSKTADTINRAIDNNQGTTTTAQGATSAGLIITEDLQPIVECTGGYTNPFIIKTISGVPPVEFHAVEGNLKFWAISGNTVEGSSVGDRTENLANLGEPRTINVRDTEVNVTANREILVTGTATASGGRNISISEDIMLSAGTYTFSAYGSYGSIGVFFEKKADNSIICSVTMTNQSATFTIEEDTDCYIGVNVSSGTTYDATIKIMLNTGDTALPYEPYGYKVPVECAGVTYNCYISDVLRKSTPATRKRKSKKAVNDTTVYDIMDSTGTVTRNVDTDGSPLETPVTESYTAPTIETIWGYNEFDVDTTVTPSNVIVEYYDN